MNDVDPFPALPTTREEIEQLREWNLEMLDAWYRKKDQYIREYNTICMWGCEVARNPTGTPINETVLNLTYSPLSGDPDRRLCQPVVWFILIDAVKKYLPRNRIRRCHERLLLIRQNGINHNFRAGSHQLAADAQEAALTLISIAEEFENRLVLALNVRASVDNSLVTDDSARPKTVATRPLDRSKPRRSKEQNAQLFTSSLTAHHGYDDGSCTNYDPITSPEFEKYGLPRATASRHIKEHFGDQKKYEIACRKKVPLCDKLRRLNGESLIDACRLAADYSDDRLPATRRGKTISSDNFAE